VVNYEEPASEPAGGFWARRKDQLKWARSLNATVVLGRAQGCFGPAGRNGTECLTVWFVSGVINRTLAWLRRQWPVNLPEGGGSNEFTAVV